MGILTNLAQASLSPEDDFWYQDSDQDDLIHRQWWGLPTASGFRINSDSARRVSAVYACVRVLSETVAQLPLNIHRYVDDGSEIFVRHPLQRLLHDQPNNWQTAFEFREMMQSHLCLRGNAYALIVGTRRQPVTQLIPLHPDRMRVEQMQNRRLKYIYSDRDGKGQMTYRDYEIFHIRGLSSEGIVGLNPIHCQRETVALSAASLDYGARFFKNDAQPRGVLEMDGVFKDREKALAFRRDWQSAQSGANRHKTALLEGGMKYTQIGLNNRDSQFLETRQYQVEDIARIFRVPPHLIGHLERSTNNNIEHQGLEFVIHTMMPWLVRWEQAIRRDLILADQLYFSKFNVDALVRGDIKTRYEAYGAGIEKGWLTRNEVRKKEGMNTLDGLDEPLQMMNMQSPGGGKNNDPNQARAEKLVRKQIVAITERAASGAPFDPWAQEYYASFRRHLRESLDISVVQADIYCETCITEILDAVENNTLDDMIADWQRHRAAQLIRLTCLQPAQGDV